LRPYPPLRPVDFAAGGILHQPQVLRRGEGDALQQRSMQMRQPMFGDDPEELRPGIPVLSG
jgi:hypothetical protein